MGSKQRVREIVPSSNNERASLVGLTDPDSPAYERDEVYLARRAYWNLVDDLAGGTAVMRAAGPTWLPKEDKEKDKSYRNRLSRSFLFNGYRDALNKMTSKPFSKPVTIEGLDSLPEDLQALKHNADLLGNNITTFASKLFWEAQHRGAVHVYVDYPRLPEGATLADKNALKARPYFKLVSLQDVLGWKTEVLSNGTVALSEVRFLEQHETTDGAYGSCGEYRIRIVRPADFEVWIQNTKGDGWTMDPDASGTHTFGSIPMVTCYLNDTGFMTAEPVYTDLAWTNLAHWQSSSDQRNILRFARTGLYYAKGFQQDEVNKIVIGPNQVISSTAENSDFKVIEYSGSSIEQGSKDLASLEEQMEVLGMRPMLERSGNVTATATASDDKNSQNQVQHWIRLLENTLTECFRLADRWVSGSSESALSDDFKIDIFNDFGITLRAASDIESLIKAREKREISRETFLRELKRRGLLNDSIDVDAEIGRIEAEGPSLDNIGNSDLFNEEEEEDNQQDAQRMGRGQ